ncbi:MAG: transglycosylase SLT domain-containing protein [Thermomicrobiales bacterium]
MREEWFDRMTRGFAISRDRRAFAAGLIAMLAGVRGVSRADAAQCKQVSERKVQKYIKSAARKYRQPYKKMLCVAQCESNLDNCAVNQAGRSYGLYQFIESTWYDPTLNPKYNRKNFWDPKWSALATAEMWSRGLSTHWDCCCPHWGCDCPGKNPPWC